MMYAITLKLTDTESIESRLKPIIIYYIESKAIKKFLIKDIDATGEVGNRLTKQKNEQDQAIAIDAEGMAALVSEGGQIFELDLIVKDSNDIRIIVRDGNSIDLIGDKSILPVAIVGEYEELDESLFKTANRNP